LVSAKANSPDYSAGKLVVDQIGTGTATMHTRLTVFLSELNNYKGKLFGRATPFDVTKFGMLKNADEQMTTARAV